MGAWAPTVAPGMPDAWLQGLPLGPRASPFGTGSACHCPGSPLVNAFCGHQGQEAADSFPDKGVELSGTEVEGVTLPSLVV